MLDKLIKQLEELNGKQISIPILPDEDGYIDRSCPDQECLFQFKVNDEDWKNKFNKESVFCPMCGKESIAEKFATLEQIENAEKQALNFVEGKIGKALKEDVRDFNRLQHKKGFLTLSMSVTGTKPEKMLLPIPAKEKLERKILCYNCNARYAIIGSAFFCPSCGNNSVEITFENTIKNIYSTIQYIPEIRTAISKITRDQAETNCRSLIEKGLIDSVMAFQWFCDVVYKKQKDAKPKIPLNVFQRIDQGASLWRELFGESYSDWLKAQELERINILFQRRHLLQHSSGIVDQVYLDKTNDTKYKIGQRINIKEKDVLELVEYINKITQKINDKIDGSLHTTSGKPNA